MSRDEDLSIVLSREDLDIIQGWYSAAAHEFLSGTNTLDDCVKLKSLLKRLGFELDAMDRDIFEEFEINVTE